MPRPLAQLYEEHSSLAAVLHAMSALVREVRQRGEHIGHFGTFTRSPHSLLLARRAE